jgi:hypothetical protein
VSVAESGKSPAPPACKHVGPARKHGVPNKMSSARVERALREGKSLPPENLLLVGCGFAMASLCTLQSRPEGGPVRLSVEAEDAALAGGGSRTNNTVIGDAPTAHSGTEVCLALDVYILSFKNSAGFYV